MGSGWVIQLIHRDSGRELPILCVGGVSGMVWLQFGGKMSTVPDIKVAACALERNVKHNDAFYLRYT
jgi:hypothetical protein